MAQWWEWVLGWCCHSYLLLIPSSPSLSFHGIVIWLSSCRHHGPDCRSPVIVFPPLFPPLWSCYHCSVIVPSSVVLLLFHHYSLFLIFLSPPCCPMWSCCHCSAIVPSSSLFHCHSLLILWHCCPVIIVHCHYHSPTLLVHNWAPMIHSVSRGLQRCVADTGPASSSCCCGCCCHR